MRTIGLLIATGLLAGCGLVPTSCPGALLEGRLAVGRVGGGGASGLGLIVETEFGSQPVIWPSGYSTNLTDEQAELLDPFGRVVATAGETVYVGGGMSPDNTAFVACGYVGNQPP